MAGRRTMLARLDTRLDRAPSAALDAAIALATSRGIGLYLVGGAVRDLLIDAPQLDLDLVTEGDAIALAEEVGTRLEARVVAHPRFGTAVVRGQDVHLDLAQARAERYERPGALPSIQRATIGADLARRDLTINAIALRLTGPEAGELINSHGGVEDLEARCVRVLHDESFRDDATRILRAARYAGRLGFEIEPHTRSLLERDLSYIDTVSGTRVRRELERIADEPDAGAVVRLAQSIGVLAAVHPGLMPLARALEALGELPSVAPSRRDAVLLCLLLSEASLAEVEAAIGRVSLTGRQASAVRALVALRPDEVVLARADLRPSAATRLLSTRPVAAIEAFALLACPGAAANARRYLNSWRSVRPRLNGDQIEALGVEHGPKVGAALAALRDARLDADTASRDDEVALVRRTFVSRSLAEAARG